MWVSDELRMLTHKGESTWATVVLPGWGDPFSNFSGSGAVVLWGFKVRCGWVKVVSSSLGPVWGVSAELRMLTHKGEGTWATCSLTRLGTHLPYFGGSGAARCGISSERPGTQYYDIIIVFSFSTSILLVGSFDL